MPFLAGTLRQDSRGAFTIEIPQSPHAGTRFHYADLTRDFTFPSFQELKAAGFPYADGKMDGLGRLRPNPFPTHVDGCPVIVPQLTHVRGGLILTCSYSHLVADLLLFTTWCSDWALQTSEIALATAEGRAESPVPPSYGEHVFDRTPLTPPNPGPMSLEDLSQQAKAIPDWLLVDPTNAVALENMKNIVPPAYIPPSNAAREQELRKTTCALWRFSPASLKALHSAVSDASTPGTKHTVIDVLTAFLWSHIFRAKYIDPSSPTDTSHLPPHSRVVYAADIRRRLDPPLPKAFLGAAVDLFHCTAPASTLATPNSMAAIASLATSLRHSNTSFSSQKYQTLLSLSQRTPTSPGFVPAGPIDVLATDHSRGAPARNAHWGPGLGVAVAFREPYLGRTPPAGEITIFPRCADGGLEVCVAAERAVVERLCKDDGLGRWGEGVWVLGDVVVEKGRRDRRGKL